MLGAASGAVSGLVAITPACGFVGPMGALVIGLVGGIVCLWGVNGLKRMLRVDDSLDVFGVHGVGGIVGALLTGVFAAPQLGGQGVWDYVTNKPSADAYSIGHQLLVQAEAIGITIVWSAFVAFVAFKLVDMVIGLRVPENLITLALLEELGEPLIGTTLQLPGDDHMLSDPDEVRERLEKQIDLVIDGGAGTLEATTIVDLTGPEPVLLREGRGDPAAFGL